MVVKETDGKKQLFIQLTLSEQEGRKVNGQMVFNEKANGVSFAYSCLIDWNTLDHYNYGNFVAGLNSYFTQIGKPELPLGNFKKPEPETRGH